MSGEVAWHGRADGFFSRTCLCEWRKLASLPSLRYACAAILIATPIIMRALRSAGHGHGSRDPLHAMADHTAVGFVVFGTLVVTSEYATGQMPRSLLSEPRRIRLACAKLLVLIATAGGSSAIAYAVGAAFAPVRPSGLAAFALYSTVLALLSGALGFLLRGHIASLTVAIGCLVLVPPFVRGAGPWASWLPSELGHRLMEAMGAGPSPIRGAQPSAWAALLALAAILAGTVAAALARFDRADA